MSAITSVKSDHTKCGSMNLSCSDVPQRTSPLAIGLVPEPRDQRAQQQRLGKAHLRVRRHFEAAEFDETKPPGRAVGRIELVDADFRPVGVAGRRRSADCGRCGPPAKAVACNCERSGTSANAISSSYRPSWRAFIDARRLARRPDEQAGEQIRQRRMILPIGDQALQQIGPPQERRVRRRRRRPRQCGCRRRCRCGVRPA